MITDTFKVFSHHQQIRRLKTLHMIILDTLNQCHFNLIKEIIYHIIIINNIVGYIQVFCYIRLCTCLLYTSDAADEL